MKFIPLGDRVLIKPDGVMTETASGMIIPPTSQGEVKTGVVMAVGPKVAGVVKEGDRVIYSPHSISEAEVDGVKVIYLREGDCHFIISPEYSIDGMSSEELQNTITDTNQLTAKSNV